MRTVMSRLEIGLWTLWIWFPVASQSQNLLDFPTSAGMCSAIQSPGIPTAGASDTTDESSIQNNSNQREQDGLARRSVSRILEDQKEIYLGPLHPRNFKWDLLVLAGTGALLATDRRIERHRVSGNQSAYSNMSNIALGSIAGTLSGLWGYGIKVHDEHLKETGSLELETMANTFLVYLPAQLIAARQRPGVGNGNGDFWRHHSINTSFPAGHPMFTMAMATVLAHEYPKRWVQILAYGSVALVATGRLLAHDHWASDELVGVSLGYFIGSHIFHSRCRAQVSEACHPTNRTD